MNQHEQLSFKKAIEASFKGHRLVFLGSIRYGNFVPYFPSECTYFWKPGDAVDEEKDRRDTQYINYSYVDSDTGTKETGGITCYQFPTQYHKGRVCT